MLRAKLASSSPIDLRILCTCAVLLCAFATPGSAQNAFIQNRDHWETDGSSYRMDRFPRPSISTSLHLNGGGYSTTSQSLGAGLSFERGRLMLSAGAGYNNARKVNDGTVGNTKGHTRNLGASTFVRINPIWYVGGGVNWGQLSTTNYMKSNWHPEVGVGRDWYRDDFSARTEMVYVGTGSDHTNGSQGATFRLWIPSPSRNSHILFREQVGIYTFHATLTDPSNQALTAMQMSNRSHATYVQFGIVIR